MPATVATEPKGINPLRNIVEGIFPPNLGSEGADGIAQENLKRIQSKTNSPSNPPAPDKVKAPETSPQLAKLAEFSDPKTPAPAPVLEPKNPEPVAPPVEHKPEPSEPKLSDDLPVPGFEDLEAALSSKTTPAKPEAKTTSTEKILTGEVEPTLREPSLEEAEDAPIVIPKTAKETHEAIIKLSKLNREKAKKIKELEAKGTIDTAAMAAEPLLKRIADLESERSQFLNTSAAMKLESHPEIQQRYIQPIRAAEAFINEVVKNNENISAREIFQAVNEPDAAKRKAAVKAACTDLDADDTIQVRQAVDAIHKLNGEWSQVRNNATQISENMEKQQKELTAAQMATRRSQSIKAHDESFKEFVSDPMFSRFAEKDPQIKKTLDGILEAAKAAEVDTSWVQNDKLRSRAIQQALAFPVMKKLYENQIGELLTAYKKLQKQNLSLKAPGVSTQPRSAYNPPAQQNGKPQSTADIVHSVLGEAMKNG